MLLNKLIKTEDEVIKLIVDSLKAQKPVLFTYLNQHCFNIYNRDPGYRNLLDNMFTVFLDGFGVYAALKFLGYRQIERFNATDLYEKIFKRFVSEKKKLFLVGGNFKEKFVQLKAAEKMLSVCGYRNGYNLDDDLADIIKNINELNPDVIIIGMGVPMQEFLAEKISGYFKGVPVLCVGGFLDFYFGTKKRAPAFLRNSGLEWIHRLIKEPDRLWKRYVFGIPVFIYHIVRLKLLSKL